MHIKKYDFDYSRRFFMEKTAKGLMGAGVLTSLWPLIGNTGEIGKAYPEELQSLEAYTKGKVKEGDVITAANVEHVKDLLDPVAGIRHRHPQGSGNPRLRRGYHDSQFARLHQRGDQPARHHRADRGHAHQIQTRQYYL